VALVLALAAACLIALDRPCPAAWAYAAHTAVALGLLRWGLSVSDHSDGKILDFALVFELPGLTGVLLGLGVAGRDEQPAG
jgi:hypothetical protein